MPNLMRPEELPLSAIPIGEASTLPARTGVYVFRDRHGNALYVGKARDLRRRVAQHLREGLGRAPGNRPRRKRILMTAAHSVAWMPAETELEALLLEDRLIKTCRPSFNRRQNKFTRQVYLEMSFDGRACAARITDQPQTPCCYGPFSDRFYAERLAAILDEHFGVSPPVGGGLRGKEPQAGAAERFLLGFDDGLVRSLEDQTSRLASDLQFERAAAVRDQAAFCRRFLRRQAFIRAFASGTLVVSEARPPQESLHYLFAHGRLVDRAEGGIPADWQRCTGTGPGPEPGPAEPRWVLSERAMVVYTWLSTDQGRKSVRVLGEAGS